MFKELEKECNSFDTYESDDMYWNTYRDFTGNHEKYGEIEITVMHPKYEPKPTVKIRTESMEAYRYAQSKLKLVTTNWN